MQIVSREFKNKQKWEVNNLLYDGTCNYYLIVEDFESNKFALLYLNRGTILLERYSTIADLKKENGDLNPVSHAEIFVEE